MTGQITLQASTSGALGQELPTAHCMLAVARRTSQLVLTDWPGVHTVSEEYRCQHAISFLVLKLVAKAALLGSLSAESVHFLCALCCSKFTPTEEFMTLPGDIARTEFRLVATYQVGDALVLVALPTACPVPAAIVSRCFQRSSAKPYPWNLFSVLVLRHRFICLALPCPHAGLGVHSA